MKVSTLDLQFGGVSQTIASYLIEGDRGLALIETGPTTVVETTIAQLAQLGFRPKDIQHVFVTHIHLDHAGAAGWWAAQGAQIYVHPRGARHLIDPSRLMASAGMVYGAMLDQLFGAMLPIPAEQVTVLEDNETVQIGDLTVSAWDTQGHAKHHHCYVVDDVVFTGDAAGSRMPHERFINLTSAPPQFDPAAFDVTIDRLLTGNFAKLYLGHFGAVDNVTDHLERLREVVWHSAEFVRQQHEKGLDDAAIIAAYVAHCRERALADGVSPDMLHTYDVANGFKMSGEGILLYWKKR